MAYGKELAASFLKNGCDPGKLPFDNTSELEPYSGIIGQERAARAMEFGLNIRMKGYNIYLSGTSGTGKTSYAVSLISKAAANKSAPDDWCYVYNFDKHASPTAINLPAGQGKIFRDDMDNFIKVLKVELSKAFDSDDYEKEKSTIIKEFQDVRSELMEELSGSVEKYNFKVKSTSGGIYFVPVIDGKVVDEEQYGDLDEKVRHDLSEKSNEIQLETLEIVRKIKDVEKKAESKVGNGRTK